MSTRSEWEAAAEEFMATERERLGGPPTPEEVVAYARGELPEAEAARVRSLLVYYPELTSVLTEPAPRMAPRRPVTPVRLLAVAASALFIISAGLVVQVQRLRHELNEPHVLAVHDLEPKLLTRGSAQPPNRLIAGEKGSLLVLDDLPEGPRYRIELMNGAKKMWSVSLKRQQDEPVSLSLPRGLPPGSYRLDAYGADDSTPLAVYELRVSEPAQE
ncbi:MAG TPA: hypothetical protein VJ276_13930 [Thermoanaerobaculia bacterium]|nr:hypothetical protein [Thermoanaerobaculia bacterium]